MRIENPADWVRERLEAGRPCFAVRINDGEMIQIHRTQPEGSPLGTTENPAPCRWDLGNALREMLVRATTLEHAEAGDVMVGHCCHDDPENALNKGFWSAWGNLIGKRTAEAGGHWPLDAACDGSLRRLIEAARSCSARSVLVTNHKIADAGKLFSGGVFLVEGEDSWRTRNEVHHSLALAAVKGMTFFWCAGAGLKPTAWRLFREHPQSSHVDLGHVFNGALGLRDYGWLQRQDGWWDRYFAPGGFAEWVRKECGL